MYSLAQWIPLLLVMLLARAGEAFDRLHMPWGQSGQSASTTHPRRGGRPSTHQRPRTAYPPLQTPLPHCRTRPLSTALRGGSVVMAASTTVAVKLWIVPAIACATAYALYNLFLKQAAMAGMDPVFGGVFMQVGASIATLALLARRYAFQSSAVAATAYPMSRTAILWAIAAGVSVGGAELLSFVVSGLGVPATQSIPVLIGGSVLVGTVLGRLWLGELLNWQGWLGVALISLGIALVGMASPGGMH